MIKTIFEEKEEGKNTFKIYENRLVFLVKSMQV
jgi:hypothetical protein